MGPRTIHLGAFVLALACCLTACPGDDDASSAGDGGASSSGNGSKAGEIDACTLLTMDDASALFGQPAKRDSDEPVVDPALLGQCHWTYEEEDEIGSVYSQSVHFYAWDSPRYHSAPTGADPLDVGEDGYVKWSEATGVDTGWLQNDRSYQLYYFSIGDTMPSNESKVDDVKALALTISQRL